MIKIYDTLGINSLITLLFFQFFYKAKYFANLA